MMKLYTFPLSPNCQKVVALAHEVRAQMTTVHVDLFKGEHRAPEIALKNPNVRLPILEDGDFVLWESNAILAYVAHHAGRADLAPTSPRERADVDRWLSWGSAHFAPAVRKVAFERVVKKLAGLGAPDEALIEAGSKEVATFASVLDRSLEGREFLCGTLTIADFANAPAAALCEPAGLDLTPYPNARRWLGRMLARESMQYALRSAREAA